MKVPVVYKGALVDADYRVDLLIDRQLVLELKAVHGIAGVHLAQVLTYLRVIPAPLGLIVNFNVPTLRERGIRRVCLQDPPVTARIGRR